MAYTQQITVNNIAATAVIAQSNCRQITVRENIAVAGWPTTDFLVLKPTAVVTGIRIAAGASYTFTKLQGLFAAGDTVGYLQTIAGSTTFDQDEDQP